MASVEADAANYLDKSAKHDQKFTAAPAVLFDVDYTTLNTYSYEIYSNFVFNPTSNAAFVNTAAFPAVPGMPTLAAHAADDGYTVFFLTGRPEAQRPGTVTNLTNAGYTVVSNQLYLKDQTHQAWLSSCSPTCTTTQYKSLTRQHIESLGYDIVANFGDQFSDLNGGFADETFKIPNPMYFLP
jgi:predicted secreted acid phosphatase